MQELWGPPEGGDPRAEGPERKEALGLVSCRHSLYLHAAFRPPELAAFSTLKVLLGPGMSLQAPLV